MNDDLLKPTGSQTLTHVTLTNDENEWNGNVCLYNVEWNEICMIFTAISMIWYGFRKYEDEEGEKPRGTLLGMSDV